MIQHPSTSFVPACSHQLLSLYATILFLIGLHIPPHNMVKPQHFRDSLKPTGHIETPTISHFLKLITVDSEASSNNAEVLSQPGGFLWLHDSEVGLTSKQRVSILFRCFWQTTSYPARKTVLPFPPWRHINQVLLFLSGNNSRSILKAFNLFLEQKNPEMM